MCPRKTLRKKRDKGIIYKFRTILYFIYQRGVYCSFIFEIDIDIKISCIKSYSLQSQNRKRIDVAFSKKKSTKSVKLIDMIGLSDSLFSTKCHCKK